MQQSDKANLRSLVKSLYDAQQLRIQEGNRIVGNIKIRLGQQPGAKTEVIDEEGQKLLKTLVLDFKRITDGVVTSRSRDKIKALEKSGGVIADKFELALVGHYAAMLDTEAKLEKDIADLVHEFPIWDKFLKNVRGCGEKMSAVIISELDPYKARSISSFWRYAGLDVVINEEGVGEGRSRKAHHLVDQTYIDKEGNEKTKKGIGFNPFLKTKLVGVLGSNFIKQGDVYREIYDGYKHRLESNPRYAELTKGHRHNMAVRYAVKMFLKDLWLAWRTLEGLEIRPDYAEGKLGIKHSA